MKRRRTDNGKNKQFKSLEVQKIEKIAARVINQKMTKIVDIKHYDTEQNLQFISNTGTIFNLSRTLTQGVANNQRIGDEVMVKSTFIRCFFRANLGSANYHSIRLVLFTWASPGDPVPTSILNPTTSTQDRHLGQVNETAAPLIRILRDDTHIMSSNAAHNIPLALNKKYFTNVGSKARWDNSGSNISGNVYLLAISDSAALDAPQLSFVSRVKYTDQ